MIKQAEMQMPSNSIKSIKASVRELYNHALNKQGDGEPGETTKTLKFKIDPSPENQIQLTKIFDALIYSTLYCFNFSTLKIRALIRHEATI
jgi:hypothetical protein